MQFDDAFWFPRYGSSYKRCAHVKDILDNI